MEQETSYTPLLTVAVFFIIGANFPSNGVDDAIYKAPGAIMHDTMAILSIAVVVVLIIKTIQLAKSVND